MADYQLGEQALRKYAVTVTEIRKAIQEKTEAMKPKPKEEKEKKEGVRTRTGIKLSKRLSQLSQLEYQERMQEKAERVLGQQRYKK